MANHRQPSPSSIFYRAFTSVDLLDRLVTEERNILPCGTGFPFLFIEMTYFLFDANATTAQKKNRCNKIFKLFNPMLVLH